MQLELIPPFADATLSELLKVGDYSTALPFPHLVIDHLFNPLALEKILEEWPTTETANLIEHNDGVFQRHKFASTYKTLYRPYTRFFLSCLGEPFFLEALEQVTGIQGLIPDPYWRGGGLHFTRSGGKLAVHADFNKHFKFALDRRLNLIIYLNHGWKEENRGWLELWDRDMQVCAKRVLPIFNRTALFSTTDFSYHGQPEPIEGPPDLFRKSIALYYYTNGRPAEELANRDPASTLWQARPDSSF